MSKHCIECGSTDILRRHIEYVAVEYQLTEGIWEYSKSYDGDRVDDKYMYECLDCEHKWEEEEEEGINDRN